MKRRTLAMLLYSPSVMIAANGKEPIWNNCAGWLSEYCIPVRRDRIVTVEHDDGKLRELTFEHGDSFTVDAASGRAGIDPHRARRIPRCKTPAAHRPHGALTEADTALVTETLTRK